MGDVLRIECISSLFACPKYQKLELKKHLKCPCNNNREPFLHSSFFLHFMYMYCWEGTNTVICTTTFIPPPPLLSFSYYYILYWKKWTLYHTVLTTTAHTTYSIAVRDSWAILYAEIILAGPYLAVIKTKLNIGADFTPREVSRRNTL